MADGRRHPQFGAQERRAEFGDQFLPRIGLPSPPRREVPVEAGSMAGPVAVMPISA
jgi:hypothetical protein